MEKSATCIQHSTVSVLWELQKIATWSTYNDAETDRPMTAKIILNITENKVMLKLILGVPNFLEDNVQLGKTLPRLTQS
jgi:hypothetical protein